MSQCVSKNYALSVQGFSIINKVREATALLLFFAGATFSRSLKQPMDFQSIVVESFFLPSFNIENTLITQNYGSQAIYLNSQNTDISNSTIVNNYPEVGAEKGTNDGVYIAFSYNITLSNSNIYGHGRYDVMNDSSSDIQAINNYWGTTDEMSINFNLYDEFDNSSKGEIIFYPYLTTFAPDAPLYTNK